MRILVVDDERLLVKGIKFNLENEGYQVDVAFDGLSALEMANSASYDLLILDLMMPGKNGLEVCMDIRQRSTVPIIILTAKGDDTDKLLGFEYGADDYITKPFNILELKARVRALLRRSSMQSPGGQKQSRLVCGSLELDTERRSAFRDGTEIELTAREYDLLEMLMQNPGKVYSRESLLDLVWGYDYQGDIRTVDVHIRRLREKIEADPAKPAFIFTKWGVGYYFKG